MLIGDMEMVYLKDGKWIETKKEYENRIAKLEFENDW